MKRSFVFVLLLALVPSAPSDESIVVPGRLRVLESEFVFTFRNATGRDLIVWEGPGFVKRLHFELWSVGAGFELFDRDYAKAIMGGFVASRDRVLAPDDRYTVAVPLNELTPLNPDMPQQISYEFSVSHNMKIRAVLAGDGWEAVSDLIKLDRATAKQIVEGIEKNHPDAPVQGPPTP